MHELGLMTGVMDAAVEAAHEAGATRLLGVRVSIGEATEAVEDALVFAFEALAESDPFTQGAKLGLTAVEAAHEAGATRLLGVRVSIGEATEAVEDALVFACEALAESDPFTQGAKLGLTMIRPRSVCLECGHEFEHDLYNRFCPVCDSFATELLAGRELQIDSIEVDLPEE